MKYRIHPNSVEEKALESLGFFATKLYNTDNYLRREVWAESGVIPSGFDQMKLLKENHWYRLLPSQSAQQVCKEVQGGYNSWFSLRKVDESANPPLFRRKSMLSPVTFFQQFKIIGDTIRFGMSRKFKEETGVGYLLFEIPLWREIDGVPKMATILFKEGKWMVHVVYDVPDVVPNCAPEFMGVDLGIVNLATTSDTQGNCTVYSGGEALAVQHYFNKEIARVQSKTMKEHKRSHSRATDRMHKRKFRQVNQIIHSVSRSIIEEAKRNDVGTIVVGDVKNIRKGKHWNKKGSQKLHSWAFAKLTNQITYKAMLSGIRVSVVSERYTSQTCSCCGVVRKSNRKHRGLYVCKSCGTTINADQNGARNILQKYLQDNNVSRSIGIVTMPLIWRATNVRPT